MMKRVSENISKIDQFGETFQMNITHNFESVKSVCGSIATLILVLVTMSYSYFKFDIFLYRTSMDIL